MTIYEELAQEPTDLQVTQRLDSIKQWLKTALPAVDENDPVLVSLWLGPMARRLEESRARLDSIEKFGKLSQDTLNSVSESQQASLRKVLAESLAIPETQSSFSVGEVLVEVSSSNSIIVPAGTEFSSSGGVFVPTRSVVLRSADRASNAANERLLSKNAAGNYQATIPVVASTAGELGNVSDGTTFTSSLSIPGLIRLSANADFVGGRDANDVSSMITAALSQYMGRTLGTRDQILSFLQTRSEVGNIQQAGVIGFGDPEMLRDKVFLSPVGGGKADIYLASRDYPQTQTYNLTAATTNPGVSSRLSLAIPRDIAPGYLNILSVTDSATGDALTIIDEKRGLDNSPELGLEVPYLEKPKHAAFSMFQTATLTLEYPNRELGAGEELNVLVAIQSLPQIAEAQRLVSSREYRYVAGDTLVRAAIPMFLKIRIQLETSFTPQIPDAGAIKELISNEIMRRPMRPSITQSDLVQVISFLLPKDMYVSSVMFDGLLTMPAGNRVRYAETDIFEVPITLSEQISPRTVAMYTSIDDVQLTIRQRISYETP